MKKKAAEVKAPRGTDLVVTVDHPDTGVKRYSTGDKVELAVFAAVHEEDEVNFVTTLSCSRRMVYEIIRFLFREYPDLSAKAATVALVERLKSGKVETGDVDIVTPTGTPLTLARLMKDDR